MNTDDSQSIWTICGALQYAASNEKAREFNPVGMPIAYTQGESGHFGVILRFLHTMVRASDLEASLMFYCDQLGLIETHRYDNEAGRFTLVFLAAPGDAQRARHDRSPLIEITHNWDDEQYEGGRNFGHLAFQVDDIHVVCARLMDQGVVINRPPRDGRMAFVRSPDGISIELLQAGDALTPCEPWVSMTNKGTW